MSSSNGAISGGREGKGEIESAPKQLKCPYCFSTYPPRTLHECHHIETTFVPLREFIRSSLRNKQRRAAAAVNRLTRPPSPPSKPQQGTSRPRYKPYLPLLPRLPPLPPPPPQSPQSPQSPTSPQSPQPPQPPQSPRSPPKHLLKCPYCGSSYLSTVLHECPHITTPRPVAVLPTSITSGSYKTVLPWKDLEDEREPPQFQRCPYCGDQYCTRSVHRCSGRRQWEDLVDEGRPYRCTLCHKSYVYQSGLLNHHHSCHAKQKTS